MSTKVPDNQEQASSFGIMLWEGGQAVIALIGIFGVVAGISAFLLGQGILSSAPDVRFQRIDPLRTTSGFVQGISIFNRGKKQATNLELIITYKSAKIVDYTYDEQSFLGKPTMTPSQNNQRVIFHLERISPQKERGTIYLSVQGDIESPVVDCRYSEGDCKEGEYQRSLNDTIVIICGFILFAVFLLQNISPRLFRVLARSKKEGGVEPPSSVAPPSP